MAKEDKAARSLKKALDDYKEKMFIILSNLWKSELFSEKLGSSSFLLDTHQTWNKTVIHFTGTR
jgi:hypothetical protein